MRFFLRLLLILASVGPFFGQIWAQSAENSAFITPPVSSVEVLGPKSIEVGQSFALEAILAGVSPKEANTYTYNWSFGDGSPVLWGKRIQYRYETPGTYKIRVSVKKGRERLLAQHRITVYDRQMVIISENIPPLLALEAADEGVKLHHIPFSTAETAFSTEEQFFQTLNESKNTLLNASHVVFIAKTDALQAFSQWVLRFPEATQQQIRQKNIFFVSEKAFSSVSVLVRRAFAVFRPEKILIFGPESIPVLWETNSSAETIQRLSERGLAFKEIDARYAQAWYLPLSRAMTYFTRNGVTENTLYLLLAVPFIAFLVAFVRQFVGLKTYGVYTPVMMSLSFLVLGFSFGILAFLTVLGVSIIIRSVFARVSLLYIPKVSLTLSTLALSFVFVLILGIERQTTVNLSMTIFPMLVMITVSEKFLSNQSSQGLKKALINTAETTLLSLLFSLILIWAPIQHKIIATPELVLLPLLGSLWLGRFTGLRLTEYFKFRSLYSRSTSE